MSVAIFKSKKLRNSQQTNMLNLKHTSIVVVNVLKFLLIKTSSEVFNFKNCWTLPARKADFLAFWALRDFWLTAFLKNDLSRNHFKLFLFLDFSRNHFKVFFKKENF